MKQSNLHQQKFNYYGVFYQGSEKNCQPEVMILLKNRSEMKQVVYSAIVCTLKMLSLLA